jgi:hypothetical protein
MTLRTSTLSIEGVYQGSKYLKYHVLCDMEELKTLFEALDPFWIFPLTGAGSGTGIEKESFLKEYGSWIEKLKRGHLPEGADLKKLLACAFTTELEALWKQEVPGERFIIKIAKPVVLVQAHFFTYSSIDGVFRPMTMGEKSIFWGLEFSFPQIYQDPKTMELLEVDKSENWAFFQKIKHWVRNSTKATPFTVEGKKINVPIRLGKNCFSWIHQHPQLTWIHVYGS